jgi:outer membrane protein assembly factor BamB
MSMKRLFAAWPCLLLLCAGLGLNATGLAQTTPDPLLGPWSGQVHYSRESKLMALRFELDKKNSTVMFFDLPDLKFHNLGPIPVKQQGDEYKAYVLSFRLASDKKNLSGLWSFDGHDLPFELKPGALPAQLAPQPAAGRVAQPAWTFKTGGAIWSSPAVAENTVYFGSNDGIIYALKADSGKPVWQFKTGGRVMGHPTLDGQYLYALSDDGCLYKLERKTGKPVWQFDTHGGSVARDMPGSGTDAYDYLTSATTVVDGTVYIGSADKKLYAVEAETGREKWHYDTQGIVRSTPTAADGRVFIGSRDHNIYAVDAKTGALKWKYDTLREVVSSPLVVDGTVYIGSRCSDLFALDATTGKVKWKYFYWSSWVESSTRMRDGILYVGSSDSQQLFAIDAATGKRIWSFDTDGSAWSTPTVTDKRVYIGAVGVLNYIIDHHGGFFAVDRATGNPVWRYPMTVIPGSATYGVASSPAVDHGLVFFGGLDGTFYAFRTDD